MHYFIQLMKALSDETRLRIFNLLLERECCVCEVMQALDISQSRASRNLGILQNAGLLKTRRDGLWVLYSIDRQTANRHATSLARLLQEQPIKNEMLTEDRRRLKLARRIGPSCTPAQKGKSHG
jgi:ArsR family transcriptional regulator